jgi:hypothetical protein
VIISVQLNGDDVNEILRAAFQYNGYSPSDIVFYDVNGQVVTVSRVVVACEGGTLKVRVAPEATLTPEETAKLFSTTPVAETV